MSKPSGSLPIVFRGAGTHLQPMSTTPFEHFARSFSDGSARAERIARLEALANLLDTAVVVPGTNIRFGLDALIGLVPAVGDVITTAISLYIVHEARQLGAPRYVVARMLANVAIDGVIGAVPLVGDAFDVLWRANRKNVLLLREYLARQEAKTASRPAANWPNLSRD